MKLKMVTYPNKLLRQKSEAVKHFDQDLQELANTMLESLPSLNGVGLSAVQVGRLIRLFVVDTRVVGESGVFINPQIVATSQDNVPYEEGCLSVPLIFASVLRPSRITIQAFNLNGKPFTIEAGGLFARAIQHEMDHLDGKLFIDRLEDDARKYALKEYKKRKRTRA